MAVTIKRIRPYANKIRSERTKADINTAEALDLIEQNEIDLANAVNDIVIETQEVNFDTTLRYPDRT